MQSIKKNYTRICIGFVWDLLSLVHNLLKWGSMLKEVHNVIMFLRSKCGYKAISDKMLCSRANSNSDSKVKMNVQSICLYLVQYEYFVEIHRSEWVSEYANILIYRGNDCISPLHESLMKPTILISPNHTHGMNFTVEKFSMKFLIGIWWQYSV